MVWIWEDREEFIVVVDGIIIRCNRLELRHNVMHCYVVSSGEFSLVASIPNPRYARLPANIDVPVENGKLQDGLMIQVWPEGHKIIPGPF